MDQLAPPLLGKRPAASAATDRQLSARSRRQLLGRDGLDRTSATSNGPGTTVTGSSSGAGTSSSIGSSYSYPSVSAVNEHIIQNTGLPDWVVSMCRMANERPSRIGITRYDSGCPATT